MLEAVTPVQAKRIAVPGWKLVPAMLTLRVDPAAPPDGVTEVRVGGPATPLFTVNVTGLLTPFAVLALIVYVPGAAAKKTAEIEVALELTPLAVKPELVLRVAPPRLFPLRITDTGTPATPLGGLIPVNDGGPALMLKLSGLLTPPTVVATTLTGPEGATDGMLKTALIEETLDVKLLTTMPPPTVRDARVRLPPVMVTGTL